MYALRFEMAIMRSKIPPIKFEMTEMYSFRYERPAFRLEMYLIGFEMLLY